MNLQDLYVESIKNNYIDLQALILFLVDEKKVLTFQDSQDELKFYYQDKFRERLTKELTEYKKKIGIESVPLFYKVTTKNHTTYLKVNSMDQVTKIIKHKILKADIVSQNLLMDNGKRLKDITKDTPAILGFNKNEHKYKLKG